MRYKGHHDGARHRSSGAADTGLCNAIAESSSGRSYTRTTRCHPRLAVLVDSRNAGLRLWHPGRHATDVAGLPKQHLKCLGNRTVGLGQSTNGAAHTSRGGWGAPCPRTTWRAGDRGRLSWLGSLAEGPGDAVVLVPRFIWGPSPPARRAGRAVNNIGLPIASWAVSSERCIWVKRRG